MIRTSLPSWGPTSLICILLFPLVGAAWAADADPIASGSWTMVLLPDSHYHHNATEGVILTTQMKWIRDHATSHNIKMVLQQGDVSNHNMADQFARTREAFAILNAAGVPYSIAPGNHDYGPGGHTATRDSLFNDPAYLGPGSAYALQPHFKGAAGGFFESGKTDNSWCTFNAGGKEWLAFSTEFGPRDEVVAWINSVAAAHPNHNLILNVHAYLYYDGTRHDWAAKGASQSWNPHNYGVARLPGGVNDGQELWDKLVKKYANWKFTFNGHVLNDGADRLASRGDHGNVVHQILANFQMKTPYHGNGYLRIMEFLANGDTVKVSTYSPYLGTYLTSADQSFTLSMTTMPTIRGASAAAIDTVRRNEPVGGRGERSARRSIDPPSPHLVTESQ